MSQSRLLAALLLCSAGVVAALAVAYPHDPVHAIDLGVARQLADSPSTALEWLARPLSAVGGGLGLALVTVMLVVVLVRARRSGDASSVVLAYVGSQVSTQVLKAAIDRPRPTIGPVVDLPVTAAFPSGHASVSLAVLTVAAVVVGGRELVPSALALALAIGLSRVALGVHWTSDVVAGWALGAFWVALCLLVRGRRAGGR